MSKVPVWSSLPSCCDEQPSFSFSLVSEQYVLEVMSELKPTNCALDICHGKIIKECSPLLVKAITAIINKSFGSGYIPSSLKHTSITPLLKKTSLDPFQAGNYRPINNVSFLLKILDKIAHLQLQQFVQIHNLLGKYQSGFRASHSTEMSMLDIQSSILSSMDNGKACLLMFLDLSAAFDVLDHQILLERLSASLNLGQIALSWFKLFLSDRTATVVLEQCLSDSHVISQGVPQGACLSPLLFNLYVKPLHDLLVNRGVIFQNYADDTQLVLELSGDYVADSMRLNELFDFISSWMTDCWLCLNGEKTELLLLGSKNTINKIGDSYKSFSIDQHTIIVQNKAKSLGIYLNSAMDMEAHVSYISRSAHYYVRLLRQLRPFLSDHDCACVARAIVFSKLDYGNSLLIGASNKLIGKLQLIQNSVARITKQTPFRDHITPTLQALHWLPIKQRIKHKALTIVQKCLHGHAPAYLKDRVYQYIPGRSLRSSDQNLLAVKRTKLVRSGGRAFENSVVKHWNCLPSSLRAMSDPIKFKQQLKYILFKDHFT